MHSKVLLDKSVITATNIWPGRFPGITGNAGNHREHGKLHKSNQILRQSKRNNIMFGKNLTSKNTKKKIFRRFRVLERGLW